MKKLLTSLFIFATISAFGQVQFPINENGEIEYSEVVRVDSTISADQLYSRAKMVIADLFNSAQSVIQNDDATNKQILVKGKISADYSWGMASAPGHVDFTMTIFCKGGRYKYSIKPQQHTASYRGTNYNGGSLLNEKPDCGTFNMPKSYWEKIKINADATFKSFTTTLKQKMNENSQKEDW